MIHYNVFEERVEKFNDENEKIRLNEIENGKRMTELNETRVTDVLTREKHLKIFQESYSIAEVQELLQITEDEARKLVKSGLFKSYFIGNEYRASKKSVAENRKTIDAMLTYQNKKTMTVADMKRILGLGKTSAYRLINQCQFKTYLVFGKMRIDIESFEQWYAGQFHYKKVNGERPGQKYGNTISAVTVAKVLGIPRSTASDLMNDGLVEYIWVDGKRRIIQESFEQWYSSQDKYKKVMQIEEVEGYVD